MGKREEDAQMPNEIGSYDESDTAADEFDESDTTADEFDAMWEAATPVDTIVSVAVNTPGQNFLLSGFMLLPASYTNDENSPLTPPTIVPDTTASAAVASAGTGTKVPLPA
jgi:hypothetical protein